MNSHEGENRALFFLVSRLGENAQSLVEFAIFSGVILFVFIAVCTMFFLGWQRSYCSYRVFEMTHRQLVTENRAFSSLGVFEDNDFSVKGKLSCGSITEEMELLKLESARW